MPIAPGADTLFGAFRHRAVVTFALPRSEANPRVARASCRNAGTGTSLGSTAIERRSARRSRAGRASTATSQSRETSAFQCPPTSGPTITSRPPVADSRRAADHRAPGGRRRSPRRRCSERSAPNQRREDDWRWTPVVICSHQPGAFTHLRPQIPRPPRSWIRPSAPR